MKIERFEDLECWKEARILVNMVYDAINSSEKFRKDYRLRDQITEHVGWALPTKGNAKLSESPGREYLFFHGGYVIMMVGKAHPTGLLLKIKWRSHVR